MFEILGHFLNNTVTVFAEYSRICSLFVPIRLTERVGLISKVRYYCEPLYIRGINI